MAKITERGWGGHFCMLHQCLFRRNTLIEGNLKSFVISTVGNLRENPSSPKLKLSINTLGENIYYETKIFGIKSYGPYIEADPENTYTSVNNCEICAINWDELPKDVDNLANEMHDTIVNEFKQKADKPYATKNLDRANWL